MPDPSEIEVIEEPYIQINYMPHGIIKCSNRLKQKDTSKHVRVDYLDKKRCLAVYQLPLSEIS
jgi:GTP-binding protein LepA